MSDVLNYAKLRALVAAKAMRKQVLPTRYCMKMVSLSSAFTGIHMVLMCSMIHLIDTVQYDSHMMNVKVKTKLMESKIGSKLQLSVERFKGTTQF